VSATDDDDDDADADDRCLLNDCRQSELSTGDDVVRRTSFFGRSMSVATSTLVVHCSLTKRSEMKHHLNSAANRRRHGKCSRASSCRHNYDCVNLSRFAAEFVTVVAVDCRRS